MYFAWHVGICDICSDFDLIMHHSDRCLLRFEHFWSGVSWDFWPAVCGRSAKMTTGRERGCLTQDDMKKIDWLKSGAENESVHMCVCLIISSVRWSSLVCFIHFFYFSLCTVNGKYVPVCCRTKALVLELLAAICLVSGGHSIIVRAFDYFKEVSK